MVQTVRVLPYHQAMNPKWIGSNAVITGPYTLNTLYLEILPTTGDMFQRVLRVQLVAPNTLTSNDGVTVTVTVAMNTTIADSTDHDPVFGISDGESFIGFIAHDKDNYPTLSPCHKIEGKVAATILQNTQQGSGPKVASRTYSSEIKMQIKPTEKWGSCHTEHDEGFVNPQDYQRSLDLTKTLYLEAYRNHANEKYRIKYIVVDVDLD